MGRSLLFVEPIYLQAVRSPMPELRLVVLATQERLGYGTNFDEAMTSLFGDTGKPQIEEVGKKPEVSPSPGTPKPAAPPTVPPPGNQTVQQLVNQAIQEFEEYQRLTAQGKLAEAGQKLEQHKRTLEELRRVGGKVQ
jgi:uncharacterized membrane protein (UPF0182 family)